MSDIKALREQMARIATEARAKIDEIKEDTPEERAAELESQFDAAMVEHDKLQERAERLEKIDRIEANAREAEERAREDRKPKGSNTAAPASGEGEEVTYRAAFHAYIRAEGNIALLDAEERAVLQRGYSKVEFKGEQRAQTVGTNSAGGFTVPEEMMREITRSMKAWGPMYDEDICRVITTAGGNPMPFPTVDDTTVTAGAHTEGASLTDDGGKDVTFGEKQLDAFAYNTEWLRVSKELADDSAFAMESLIGSLLGERLGRIANLQLTTGTGSSAPNGIVTASTAGVTAASATAITSDELFDLQHSVDPAYRRAPSVRWMFNDSTFKAIRKLKDGDGNYLWQMGDVRTGAPGMLLDSPYSVNQDMASIATGNKTILFGDFGKYFVRKVGAPLIGALQDKNFWPGFGVAGYIRFDGELSDTASLKHLVQA